MCGEHAFEKTTTKAAAGSSPHVRGTPVVSGHAECVAGIIPACAGNTLSGQKLPAVDRDHPRMCGEHFKLLKDGRVHEGSSPHVRGTH